MTARGLVYIYKNLQALSLEEVLYYLVEVWKIERALVTIPRGHGI